MPQSTETNPQQLSKPSSRLSRFIPSSVALRKKVFFDSPGFLEQSQHWGGLVIWTIAVGTTASLFGPSWAELTKLYRLVERFNPLAEK